MNNYCEECQNHYQEQVFCMKLQSLLTRCSIQYETTRFNSGKPWTEKTQMINMTYVKMLSSPNIAYMLVLDPILGKLPPDLPYENLPALLFRTMGLASMSWLSITVLCGSHYSSKSACKLLTYIQLCQFQNLHDLRQFPAPFPVSSDNLPTLVEYSLLD